MTSGLPERAIEPFTIRWTLPYRLQPDDSRICARRHRDPKGCEYLGEATGNQGNFFTGGWTSNANLETGARNELKNVAHRMGGNTLLILSSRAGVTGSFNVSNGYGGGSSEQTNVTYSGAVYRCPD